jgi:hypothetical protein
LMCVLCDFDYGFIQNTCKFFKSPHLSTLLHCNLCKFYNCFNCIFVCCIVSLIWTLLNSCCFLELMWECKF